MVPMVRRLITRIFGSDEVEQHYSVDSVSSGMAHREHYYPRGGNPTPPTTPAETSSRELPQQPRRKPAPRAPKPVRG
jgi:hypothetical protein